MTSLITCVFSLTTLTNEVPYAAYSFSGSRPDPPQRSRKEELFDALVAPRIEEFHGLYGKVLSRELEDLDTGVDKELTSISYAIAHRDEFRLLFECSRGTQYEGFKDRLIDELFYPGYQAVFDRYAGKPVDPALVKLILKMKFEEYMELIYGDYTMEEVRRLIKQISIFSTAGFHGLLKELHTER